MKSAIAAIGVLLVLLGVLALIHPSFTYHKSEEVAKIGSLRATVNEEKTNVIPTPVSVVVLAAGIVLLVIGVRRAK